jgi:hypothetical protein
MYFTVQKFAIWILLLCIQITVCWAQAIGVFDRQQKAFNQVSASSLDDTAKGEVDARCKYFFCGG